ncbi:dTDP-4-dehydrorhamnose reductase [uncultured Maribacter sp.]|uniref:dTDP-4-dehydrorhamnose reductase n=1 Tax=uncultured Maribacter sp. TaxID=431308 RepID=UPI00260F843C|nr:dTDP-4-dehydrorhamnose reductase [uncultured Maribacter sp.]
MKKKSKILVTGSNGQLGKCIRDLVESYPNYNFHFRNSKELNVTKKDQIESLFLKEDYDYCINCAAYTAVDKAELEEDKAYLVNAEAVKYLAETCKENSCVLIHISTDFVFDGTKSIPYTENDTSNPVNIYGASKLKGEKYIRAILSNYFIIRTSWVYSKYGNNFVKTMLQLGRERDEISVVNDQVGTPTYAGDLGKVILSIIKKESCAFGVYHYSNEGVASWFDLAKEIFESRKANVKVNSIPTSEYPTAAKRPTYSVLDKSKIKNNLDVEISYWRDSLKIILEENYK